METRRSVRKFHGAGARAGKPVIPDGLHPFQALRHRPQHVRRAFSKPEAVARLPVDELERAVERPEPSLRGRLFPDELVPLLFGEQIEPSVDGLVSDSDRRHIAKRLGAAFDEDIRGVKQVGVDVGGRPADTLLIDDETPGGQSCSVLARDGASA